MPETVDFTGVTLGLFILNIIFVMLIFSMFSMAVLRFFQVRHRSGWMYVLYGVISIIVFYLILKKYYM